MASKFKLLGTPGQPVDRKQYLVYGNTGTYSSPDWHVIGKQVETSTTEEDWSEESSTDILGDTHTNMKTPITDQSFET